MLLQKENENFEVTPPHLSGGLPSMAQPLEMLSANPGDAIMRYAAGRENIIALAQGQSDWITPDFIMDAAQEAMRAGKTFYGPTQGEPVFLQAVSEYYQRVYGRNIDPSRVFATPSGTAAMHIALSMLLKPGDHLVAVTPIWKNLLGAVELTGADSAKVSLDLVDGKWQLDLNKLFAAVTMKTKAILLVTPSNPTGWTASEEEIRQIMDFARANGLWVIADEVYGRMVYDGSDHAPSFLGEARDDDPLLVVNSLSKNWAMTGWRLGWLVGPKQAAEKIRNAMLYNHLCVSGFLQYGAAAALNEGEAFLAEHRDLWGRNRESVMDRLGGHERIELITPQATYYALFRVKGEGDCMALARKLVDQAGVALAPGCAFGEASKGYLRLCFACGEEKLAQVLDRMEASL